jgi:hypothetical protein
MRLLIHDDALQSAHFNGPAIFLCQDALIALAFVIAIEWEIAARFCLLPAIISSSIGMIAMRTRREEERKLLTDKLLPISVMGE